MMDRLRRGEAVAIICWKLDRLARNPVDGGAIIWAMKQQGLKIITPTQTYSQEEENTILMYIGFGMAQKYIEDLGRNVRRGLKAKVEKGWRPGKAPVGYLNQSGGIKGGSIIVNDPERFSAVRNLWDMVLAGTHTPSKAAEVAASDWRLRTTQGFNSGKTQIARATVYRILTNPFYFGYFEYPKLSGHWIQGKHEPMVTREEFDRVQFILGRNGNTRPKKELPITFRGLIRCGECGATVTGEEKRQVICSICKIKFAYQAERRCPGCHTPMIKIGHPKHLRYVYYHCSRSKRPRCRQPSVSEAELENQIRNQLALFSIPKRFHEPIFSLLRGLCTQTITNDQKVIYARKKALADCEQRLESLLRLKTDPANLHGALISDEEYAKQRRELINDRDRLQKLLSEISLSNADQVIEACQNAIEFSSVAFESFTKGTRTERRQVLTRVASNLTLKDKILRIEAVEPFSSFEKLTTAFNQNSSNIEPTKYGLVERHILTRTKPNLTNRGKRDDVRTYEDILRDMIKTIHAQLLSGASLFS
jgi:site-specific DNA recombinase